VNGLPAICSFWFGPLGWLERLCIASFVAQGHAFELYAYDELGAVPDGCTLHDAAEILPRERLFFYKGNRTPAVFADLFRLELMARGAGIWADCDVLCVKPFAGLGDYVFGIEVAPNLRNGLRAQVNNAVFRCPPQSPLLAALRGLFGPGAVPPGMPWPRRLEVAARRAFGEKLPIEHMQFGATGPWPLNHFVRRLGLWGEVSAKPVFYPVDYGAARQLLAPGRTLADVTTPETLGIHLWHSALTERGSGRMSAPASGSLLAGEAARLGIAFAEG
jgi:hypothetical protein